MSASQSITPQAPSRGGPSAIEESPQTPPLFPDEPPVIDQSLDSESDQEEPREGRFVTDHPALRPDFSLQDYHYDASASDSETEDYAWESDSGTDEGGADPYLEA